MGVPLTTVEALRAANHDAIHLRDQGLIDFQIPTLWRRPWLKAESCSHSTSTAETSWQSRAARRAPAWPGDIDLAPDALYRQIAEQRDLRQRAS
jgi:hypothetical protein